jgi:hypothetical protein
MENTPVAVSALPGQMELIDMTFPPAEYNTLVNQPLYVRRGIFDYVFDCVGPAQTGAGRQCVVYVGFK